MEKPHTVRIDKVTKTNKIQNQTFVKLKQEKNCRRVGYVKSIGLRKRGRKKNMIV